MRSWKNVLVFWFVTFALLSFSGPTMAAPTVTDTWVFTENYGPNSIPGYFSDQWIFFVGAEVDSTVSLQSVWAYANTAGQTNYELEFQYYGAAYDSYYGNTVYDYTGQMGTWDIVATDQNGDASQAKKTHNLDNPMRLDLATGITFSDDSTTPTVSWNSVNNAQMYRVVLMRSVDDQFWSSDWSINTSAPIADGVLNPGETVFVRVEAGDFESLDVLENRSSAFDTFTAPPVPIPGAVWLFGSGIIGLVGLRKKLKS